MGKKVMDSIDDFIPFLPYYFIMRAVYQFISQSRVYLFRFLVSFVTYFYLICAMCGTLLFSSSIF